MVKSYYTVIVGTRPGVYEDWIQAAPKVCGIPGAVHKKFKTCAEAWRVFDRAEREGEVRVIEVEPDAEVGVEAARALAHLSPARDNHQRPSPQGPQEALRGHAVVQAPHPGSRLGRDEIGNRTGSGNGNLPHPTRTLDPVIGLSTYPHDTGRASPGSLRAGDQGRVLGHAGSSGRGSTIRRPPRIEDNRASSSFAPPHSLQQVMGGHETIGALTSGALQDQDILSPLISPRVQNWARNSGDQGTDSSTYSFDWPVSQRGTPQPRARIEVGSSLSVPVLLRPPSACSRISVASSTQSFISDMSFDVEISAQVGTTELEPDRRSEGADASSDPSWAFSTLCDSTLVQADLSHTRDGGPLLHKPLSPSTVVLESAPENPTHLCTQVTRPNLIGIETPLRREWTTRSPSLPTHVDPQASATPTGLELSLGVNTVLSPRHLPRPQTPVVPTTPSSPVSYRTPNGGCISPQKSPEDHTYPGNAAASGDQVQSPPSCPSPGTRDHAQGVVGVELSERAAPSPRNVPLPVSPASSATSSSPSARLQVQPSHRHRPDMPWYPSLGDGGSSPPPLNLDGLGPDMAFGGLPNPALSPIQVPATAMMRSPSKDPRSPFSPWMRIPRDFMRNIFGGRPSPST